MVRLDEEIFKIRRRNKRKIFKIIKKKYYTWIIKLRIWKSIWGNEIKWRKKCKKNGKTKKLGNTRRLNLITIIINFIFKIIKWIIKY